MGCDARADEPVARTLVAATPLREMQSMSIVLLEPDVPVLPVEPEVSAAPGRGGPTEGHTVPLAVLRRLPEIECLVDGFVASWHSSDASIQCRRWHRVRFERPLLITPLDESGDWPAGEPFPVSGRDISLTGISFLHEEPLAARKVAVTVYPPAGPPGSVVTLLRWCRFRRDGVYQSGGQFLRELVPAWRAADGLASESSVTEFLR